MHSPLANVDNPPSRDESGPKLPRRATKQGRQRPRAASEPIGTERDVERACDRLVAALGGDVIRTNPPGRTRQHIGLPDRRYRVRGVAFYAELKAPGGRLSPEQLAFLQAELACGALATCGGVAELTDLVQAIARGETHDQLARRCAAQITHWPVRGSRSTHGATRQGTR